VLQLLYAYPNVYVLFSCPLLIYHVSWCHTLNPTLNLCCPCITICIPWGTHTVNMFLDVTLFLGSFRSFQTALDCCSNHSPEQHLWYADFSKALSRLSSSGNYKKTRQGALTALLPYLYKLQVVCATTMCLSHVYSAVTVQNCAFYPNIHMSYM